MGCPKVELKNSPLLIKPDGKESATDGFTKLFPGQCRYSPGAAEMEPNGSPNSHLGPENIARPVPGIFSTVVWAAVLGSPEG